MTCDVAARAGVDTDAAVAILAPLPFSTSIAVLLVVAGTWLIVTDVWLGLFATLVFPAMLVMNVLYQRKVDRFYRSAQDELGELSEAAHESFDGVLVVKAFGAEERETELLGRDLATFADCTNRRDKPAVDVRSAHRCSRRRW